MSLFTVDAMQHTRKLMISFRVTWFLVTISFLVTYRGFIETTKRRENVNTLNVYVQRGEHLKHPNMSQ